MPPSRFPDPFALALAPATESHQSEGQGLHSGAPSSFQTQSGVSPAGCWPAELKTAEAQHYCYRAPACIASCCLSTSLAAAERKGVATGQLPAPQATPACTPAAFRRCPSPCQSGRTHLPAARTQSETSHALSEACCRWPATCCVHTPVHGIAECSADGQHPDCAVTAPCSACRTSAAPWERHSGHRLAQSYTILHALELRSSPGSQDRLPTAHLRLRCVPRAAPVCQGSWSCTFPLPGPS